jgi:hypothetical protein
MSHDQLLHCYHVMCNNNKQISSGIYLFIYLFIYFGV